MEIYILRENHRLGPMSEETVQAMLKEGSISLNDLAWQTGMTGWLPLAHVLYPGSAPLNTVPPPPPEAHTEPHPTPEAAHVPEAGHAHEASHGHAHASTAHGEPATAKQMALLSYLGRGAAPDTTKDAAANFISEAMEDPALTARMARWSEDRLKLHPELFADEIAAIKEQRADHFFELCQNEGAAHFVQVTKAHCKVLVGYLDVRSPNWDNHNGETTRAYFFAAVAEKFPQLVKQAWRGKLAYPEPSRVAPELIRSMPRAVARGGGLPMAAVIRGLVFGLGIALVAYVFMHLGKKAEPPKGQPAAQPVAQTQPTASLPESFPPLPDASSPGTLPDGTGPSAPTPASGGTDPLLSNPPTEPATGTATEPGTDPATMPPPIQDGTVTPDPAGSTTSTTPDPAATPATPAPGSDPLLDPAPGTAATTPGTATDPATPAPAPSSPKGYLTLTKATEVELPFGRAKLPIGTKLKIVSQEGTVVTALYTSTRVRLPISSTDLDPNPQGPNGL